MHIFSAYLQMQARSKIWPFSGYDYSSCRELFYTKAAIATHEQHEESSVCRK